MRWSAIAAASPLSATGTERTSGMTTPQPQAQKKRALRAWLFLLPTLVVVAFVALYPLCQTFYLSFTNARLGSVEPTRVVGAANYLDILQDSFFREAVMVTVLFT